MGMSEGGSAVEILRRIKDVDANIEFRAKVRNEAVGDAGRRAEYWEMARGDVLFFFNVFLWTYDPRERPSDLPFITYPYQDELILFLVEHIEGQRDFLIEKSRDMGVTWCACGVAVWYWLKDSGFTAHFGSNKEENVDKSDYPQCIFWKNRYLVNRLPGWLLPPKFDSASDMPFMRVVNRWKNNFITGESANPNFGRGGRTTVSFLDEFAFMEYAVEAWKSLADTSRCRGAMSTVNGKGTKFDGLTFGSKETPMIPKADQMKIHWTLHPVKAKNCYRAREGGRKEEVDIVSAFKLWMSGVEIRSPWYDAECERRNEQDIAENLDINPLSSGHPYFDLKQLLLQKAVEPTIGILTQLSGKVEFRETENGWLRVFERPKALESASGGKGQYVCAGDPAEGLASGDRAAVCVREKKTRNVCATIYGVYAPDQLSYYAYLTSQWYNKCLVCGEAGGYGAGFNQKLYDLGANVARAVDLTAGGRVEKERLGFITNSLTRPVLLSDFAAEIREQAVELRDPILINECMNFINHHGKPMAAASATDDLIFATAIAGQLLRLNPYREKWLTKGAGDRISRVDRAKLANGGFSFKGK